MKILFLWTGITRCAGDCWRALSRRSGVELKIVIDEASPDAALEREVLGGLDYSFAENGRLPDFAGWTPDVLFAVGWHAKAVREGVLCEEWGRVPKVLCFDMPWRWSLRCFAARFVLWRYCRRFSAAYVPGASTARYARWLGFSRATPGFLAIGLRRVAPSSVPSEKRGGFLYVGRRSREKRLDLIERAYGRYRELGGKWPIGYHHDTPYSGMPAVYARSACLVLASEHDAWPLVALEAKASGCDVILSDRCGNRMDLATRVVPFGDVEALAREMLAAERGESAPPAQDLSFWDCNAWAARALAMAKEVTKWEG